MSKREKIAIFGYDFEISGLPEGNFEQMSKNVESTYITEFSALHNGIIGVHLR